MQPLVRATDQGLWCEEGGFHIDPWSPVDRAVVTHGHSDHAAPGSAHYLAADGLPILRARLGDSADIQIAGYNKPLTVNNVRLSFHPAGHILGSAQVRIERLSSTPDGQAGETWAISGDYKTTPDPTCKPFELVPCHTFITESTFGLPIYKWPDPHEVHNQINGWWRANQARGRTTVIFAYPLGKAQRVLARLDPSIGPIGAHGAILRINDAYAASGVALPAVQSATGDDAKTLRGTGLVLAPPSTNATTWLRKLAGEDGVATAFVSGWMRIRGARRRQHVDRGFTLSDHADWPALLDTIKATGAQHIGVTHGYATPLSRWLRENGRESFVVPSRYSGESGETPTREAQADAEQPDDSIFPPEAP
jgi:putative mRNA 3-end processing factor